MQIKSIHDVGHKQSDSPMWYDLLKVKNIYLQGRSVAIKNGQLTRFWLDPWLYSKPLYLIVPILFELCEDKGISVAQVIGGTPVSFRRWLFVDLRTCWDKILNDTMKFQLDNDSDVIFWSLEKSGKYSVKSLYNGLTKNESGNYHKRIWKGKIPEKIKIFLWLIANDAILTRENMKKRNWQGDPSCVFCECFETVNHLFFQCPVSKVIWMVVAKCFGATDIPMNLLQCWQWCEQWLPFGKKYHPWGIGAICWAIWKSRNKACFEKKLIKDTLEIICHACALMKFWSGLYAEMDQEQLVEGANTMLRVAKEVLASQTARQVNQILLQDGEQAEREEDST